MNDHELYSTVVVRQATTPIRLGDELLGGKICAASVGNLVEANIALEAECVRLRIEKSARQALSIQLIDEARALRDALAAIKGQWVPVSERLSEESTGTVAVLFDDGQPGVAWATYWHGARSGFAEWTYPLDDLGDGRSVTHWMPLPAAPEVGEK